MVARKRVLGLLTTIADAAKCCPSHARMSSVNQLRHGEKITESNTDYAFEMSCSTIRYGLGVSQEVGKDLKALGARKVCLMTDKNISIMPPASLVADAITREGISVQVFKKVRVEPTDESFKTAIDFATKGKFDAFVALGGGSVIDTCKAANLYSTNPEADFLDYVNAPIGKGKFVTHKLKPLIAIPTTTGTGSETTCVAIFDYLPLKVKTGIASRALQPTLGLVDPLNAMYLPERVVVNSGFDVLCHAMESYTACKYYERTPRPETPMQRPVYQGSNPISDVWAKEALRIIRKYFSRAVYSQDDVQARSKMHLASTFAGVGFGNAGVHLCHGMSYPISGMVKKYQAKGYNASHPIVPHGLSVVMSAPAVFQFTAPMLPERHLEVAEILGYDISNAKRDDAGLILADVLRKIMAEMKVDNGLTALGYTTDDIPALVQGTLPQKRVTKLSPRSHSEDDLAMLFEKSMTIY